ncbi:GIY-YIG nuclease family protein [Hafnia paralvei]|uniref:GIY-YIG nuclease family protein n=1 Tax=Hafnia paralvei TaxID=546367 RepID=UPI002FDC2064
MHLEELKLQTTEVKKMSIPEGFRLGGWVYILSNEHMPGIYKVGMTTNSPAIRAKELSSSTGVPSAFKVEASFHCDNPSFSEREIHEALSGCRVNSSREFFSIELKELKDICEQSCQVRANEPVEYMAMNYDVISFERLADLNVFELIEDTGLNVFGDRLAIAERLIRIGAERVFEMNGMYCSMVFHEGEGFLIQNAEYQYVMAQQEAELTAEK